jgi:hypothetical protein
LPNRYKSAGRRRDRRFGGTALGSVVLAAWVAWLVGCSEGAAKPSVSAKDSAVDLRLPSDSSTAGENAGDSQGEQRRDAASDTVRNSDTAAQREVEGRTDLGAAGGPETGLVGDVATASSDGAREDSPGRRTDTSADSSSDLRKVDASAADTSSKNAGDGGASDGVPDTDPCAGGTTYAASTSARTSTSDYGWVLLTAPTNNNNQVVEFRTVLSIPATPPASGTLFLWPGLQPIHASTNFDVLDNGVLQPVLTWGPTCAPGSPAQSYNSWWISGQYVNTNITSSSANYSAYHDCHGGPGMTVAVGDDLDLVFALKDTSWTQTVTNRRTSQSVSYTIDLLGQGQNMAEFVIEEYSSKPVSDVIFTSSVVTFASPAQTACQPAQRGINDYFSAPRASADGLRCCIDKVILRAEGVAATTPDSP